MKQENKIEVCDKCHEKCSGWGYDGTPCSHIKSQQPTSLEERITELVAEQWVKPDRNKLYSAFKEVAEEASKKLIVSPMAIPKELAENIVKQARNDFRKELLSKLPKEKKSLEGMNKDDILIGFAHNQLIQEIKKIIENI